MAVERVRNGLVAIGNYIAGVQVQPAIRYPFSVVPVFCRFPRAIDHFRQTQYLRLLLVFYPILWGPLSPAGVPEP